MSRNKGFTLVEVLIIAPIALLVIAGFVALMVTMVGDVIAGRSHNVMTYDIQSALNTIEQDVKLSTQFMTTSGTLPSPQGKNGSTSAFTSTATPNDLILGTIATDKNPLDPTRKFIYYNSPFSCSDPAQVYKNRIFFTTVIYFVKDGSLWRRTYVPAAGGTLCQTQWQVNTCSPGYASSATQCKANDSEILKNVSNFTVNYYLNPNDTVAISAAAATTASSINVSLQTSASAAGRTITSTSAARMTKLSSQDVSIPIPASPVVTATTTTSLEATFKWPSVPTATSYIVQYNINGGSWITASNNTTDTSFTLSASRGDTISVKVFARNTTGTSVDTSSNNASATIPIWLPCNLQNGWVNYGNSFDDCGYTLTRSGVVILRGLIRYGTMTNNTILFTLPEGFRPGYRLVFQVAISPNTLARIDIETNGNVRLVQTATGSDYEHLTLSGITFIPGSSLYTWTTLTPVNSWTNQGGSYSPLRSTIDSAGRVHTQGLMVPGTITNGTTIASMASGASPNKVQIFPARGSASDGYNRVRMQQDGTIGAGGIAATLYSIQTMHYPSSFNGWENFSAYVAANPAAGEVGNGWVAYGSPNAEPQFTKSDDGIVTLRGMVKNGNTANGTYIARLPSGYRPSGHQSFTVTTNGGVGRVIVQSTGYIQIRLVNATWTSLDGIHFIAS